jgi:phage gp46-like protein
MIDFKLYVDADGKLAMSYENGDSFINNILLSIYIKRGSFFVVPSLGSRLFLLKKITADVSKLAKNYIAEALQWMVDTGRMTDLQIQTEEDRDNNGLKIGISCKKQNGQDISFQTFYPVV